MQTDTYLDRLRAALVELKPTMQTAAEALAAGATHADAAEAAGVSRETVTRWAGHHPGFRAALARYRLSLAVERADKLRAIRGRAIDVVAERLDDADLDGALAVLKAFPELPDTRGESVLVTAEAILDAETRRARDNLPPSGPSRDEHGRIDTVADLLDASYGPTQDERARDVTIQRLAAASGVAEDDAQ